ncbi:hypothetical protein K450DRAFT_282252 [Umbelopsis ramanniana AG]|uniref:Choice-of-anchor A domain-containing protein n=1 Tax=Umbelopsis ramanniana AG TaxID=1314678 RepID=A0AAD5E606_UMBRA|nr:uncharacterized protein K450DRAFT_282252 [Umbelopsis ramanniana AG]KAI8577793.1 hypothetical protein K450DRAFT_282252 [Umbelopsis ramanniana AG]
MLQITSIVLALCLLQYAEAGKFITVPFRNCTVTSPQSFRERLEEDRNALSCVAVTPLSKLNSGLPFCECTYDGEGTITKLLEFNAIVFGDFTTFGGQDILGRLAVQGNFNAPNYVVNANTQPTCYGENTVPWDELALAVGGDILSIDTDVHGHWWTGGSGAGLQLNEGCDSPANVDTPFPFDAVRSDVLTLSQKMATQVPDLLLQEDGDLTYYEDLSTNCYHVMTLTPCQLNPLICLLLAQHSSPKAILLGIGNWNGPSDPYPTDGKTVIINVPVYDGTTYEISTNQPSQGANSCKIIWNFYPVDATGAYLSTGSFTIIRHTGSPFTGVVIAPLGDIIDGSSSVFEGRFYAKSYMWEHLNGVEIHDTPPCDNYHFCLPDVQSTSATGRPTNVVPNVVSSTVQPSITTVSSSIQTLTASVPFSSGSISFDSSEGVVRSTTTAPAPVTTNDANNHHTHTDNDNDYHHDWHHKDKDDDKDWHKKDDDKDWHKKDGDKDHDKGYYKEGHHKDYYGGKY